jgi:hypothetical protein
MGLVCCVAFMGAPVVILEKLVGGNESVLALRRLQQALASGVCEGDGKSSNPQVRVEEKICAGTTAYVANSEDLNSVSLDNLPLVSTYL